MQIINEHKYVPNPALNLTSETIYFLQASQ